MRALRGIVLLGIVGCSGVHGLGFDEGDGGGALDATSQPPPATPNKFPLRDAGAPVDATAPVEDAAPLDAEVPPDVADAAKDAAPGDAGIDTGSPFPSCPGFQRWVIPPYSCLWLNGKVSFIPENPDGTLNCGSPNTPPPSPGCALATTGADPYTLYVSDGGIHILFDAGGCPICP